MSVEAPNHIHNADLVRVVDGDTYELLVELDFRVRVTVRARIRGYDCPERNTPEGKAAKLTALQLLQTHPIIIRSYKDQRSFERWICDVWVNGDNIGEVLERQALAKQWEKQRSSLSV